MRTLAPRCRTGAQNRRSDDDYSQAEAYFITVCASNPACLFGEVIEGLSTGDEIVTAGQLKLREGAPVRTVGEGAPTAADQSVAPEGKAAAAAGPGK